MATTPHDLARELAVAQSAARAAGAYLAQRLGSARVQVYKAARDAQLDVDLGAEALLLDAIRSAFPDDAILSEEADPPGETAQRQWIIDPLDGSFNFQDGSSLFGVAIALRLDGATKLGVIYLPMTDEMYTAIQGQGAFCNGEPLRVSETPQISQALVHVSDFAVTGKPQDNTQRLQVMTSLANEVGRVRMVGTAAGDFGWLASGRADGLIMYSLRSWDIEAGALLVAEAGGTVTRETMPNGKDVYVGGNRHLHRDLVALLSERRA
ncbi:MAG TPA: inositol monophosphatase family protein [Ktedonobacterales bacterium]|nr:inositol monophosphatase family protein [Ktedonobacterales bacterium]